MTHQALRSGANSGAAASLVPGHKSIELVADLHQVDYYPECELQTKRWFVENVQSDWVMFDVGANIGYYSILFSQLAAARADIRLRANRDLFHVAGKSGIPRVPQRHCVAGRSRQGQWRARG